MTIYDWSKCSRGTLENLAHEAETHLDADWAPTDLANAFAAVRAQALVPPLRARAEADAEIAEIVRDYVRDAGAESAFGTMARDRSRLLRLVAEPLAPDLPPVIDCEFPEAAEPCSREESERLKARVRELEADRDHFKGIWQVECQRTLRALEHQATAEAEARALREQCNRQEHGFARRESALQGELAETHRTFSAALRATRLEALADFDEKVHENLALVEKTNRALRILGPESGTFVSPGACVMAAIGALRG